MNIITYNTIKMKNMQEIHKNFTSNMLNYADKSV